MRIGSILDSVSPRFAMMEGSHSGLVRPPAKRVGGVELPRGFESHSLRHHFSIFGSRPPDCQHSYHFPHHNSSVTPTPSQPRSPTKRLGAPILQLKFDDIPEPDIEEAGPLSMPIGVLQIRLKSQPEIRPPKWRERVWDLLSNPRTWALVAGVAKAIGAIRDIFRTGFHPRASVTGPNIMCKSAPHDATLAVW